MIQQRTADKNRLAVHWNSRLVGWLSLTSARKMEFTYDLSWIHSMEALPISLSLPLQESPFDDEKTRPFFSNLLPESAVRDAIARKLGVSEKNDFALLEAIGGECAGALSVSPSEQASTSEKTELMPLSQEELENMVRQSGRRPLLMSKDGIRLSLAGAQPKIPLVIRDGLFFLPKGKASSSHIIKTPIDRIEGTVQNEAFSMQLASKIGLNVPKTTILSLHVPLFVVERYDRKGMAGQAARIHQEDFCQALGIHPDAKYETEGGPSLADCFSLLANQSTDPALDRMALLEWTLFNYLIGNMDAHGKNVSLLIETDGAVRLAPFYDLMSTLVYPDLSGKFAMKIGGESRADWIFLRHWSRMAESIQMKMKLVTETGRNMAARLPEEATHLKAEFESRGWDHPVLGKVVELIMNRSEKLNSRLT